MSVMRGSLNRLAKICICITVMQLSFDFMSISVCLSNLPTKENLWMRLHAVTAHDLVSSFFEEMQWQRFGLCHLEDKCVDSTQSITAQAESFSPSVPSVFCPRGDGGLTFGRGLQEVKAESISCNAGPGSHATNKKL